MITVLTKLELRLLDLLSRDEILATLRSARDCVPPDFTGEWLEKQCTDRLRALLLAARLIGALRHAEFEQSSSARRR
jgi:hypothetical protein